MKFIAILAIYRFDAMFDTESALPDLSQNFETFILHNCQEYSIWAKAEQRNIYTFLVALIRYQTWRLNGKSPK